MTPLARELVAVALVGGAFLGVFLLAELWRKLSHPPVEWTRKFVHFAGGLVAAAFPWIFTTRWAVVALAATFLAILAGSRALGVLDSVHGVERRSEGGYWYPVAVLILYLIARDQPVFYLISILALVVADALAAVLGAEYGRRMYDVETDRRSLEGSAVFFLATFLIAQLPLLLGTDVGRLEAVLIATQIAIIVTQFEAISMRGNDNIVVPLATYYLLIKLTPHSAAHLQHQIVAQLLLIAIIGLAAWGARSLTLSGATALMLFMYALYSLGGPEWLVAPAIAFAAFLLLRELRTTDASTPNPAYQVAATFYVCIVGTLLLLANNALETLIPGAPAVLRTGDPLYVPFIAVVCAQFAMIFIAQVEPFTEDAPIRTRRVGAAVVVPLVLIALPGLLVGRQGPDAWSWLVTTAATPAAVVGYLFARRSRWWPHRAPWNVRAQAFSAAAVAAVVIPLHFWWIGVFNGR